AVAVGLDGAVAVGQPGERVLPVAEIVGCHVPARRRFAQRDVVGAEQRLRAVSAHTLENDVGERRGLETLRGAVRALNARELQADEAEQADGRDEQRHEHLEQRDAGLPACERRMRLRRERRPPRRGRAAACAGVPRSSLPRQHSMGSTAVRPDRPTETSRASRPLQPAMRTPKLAAAAASRNPSARYVIAAVDAVKAAPPSRPGCARSSTSVSASSAPSGAASANTSQPPVQFVEPEHDAPSLLAQTVVATPRVTASLRARTSDATSSFVCAAMRLFCTNERSPGTAAVVTTAATATVVSNSM